MIDALLDRIATLTEKLEAADELWRDAAKRLQRAERQHQESLAIFAEEMRAMTAYRRISA